MITKALSGVGQGTSSASALSAHSGKSSWIIDSGACSHMSSDLSLFISTSSSASSTFSPICTADGSQLSVSSVGSICTPGISLSDVLLGHVSSHTLLKLVSNGLLGSVSSAPLNCVSCKLGKHTALLYNSSDTRASAPFDLIHFDVWGAAPISAMGGSAYYVVFIDDFSRFVWLYLLQSRSAFYTAYVEFSTMVHTQFSKSIKIFRSDFGGEYVSHQFRALLKSHGTQHQLSCPCTPQQNGVAERKHRHILDTTRALLLSSSVPRIFWGVAILTSVYIINCLLSPVLNHSTPFASLYGASPDYSSLRVFGSTCFVLLPERERDKLSARSADAGSLPATPLSPEPSLGPALVPPLDKPSPSSSAPSLPVDPSSREASSDPLWQKAIAKELHALTKTQTWDLVSLPPGKFVIGCKWIFKVKTTADGSVDRYKARLVAKGYTQEYVRQWDLFQMDVKNAFLNGTIAEEVYMKPPPGYSHLPGQIVEFGYIQSNHDSALFTRCSSRGDDLSGISDLKAYLSFCFEMKDLGPLRYFLGLEVLPLSGGYGISQVKYASGLVSRAGLSDNKTSDTPLELNVKFRPSDGELLADPTLYRQLVGGLLYLSITHPDISFVVHVVSQFMAAPRSVHYAAVIRILRYVKGTLLQGLFMSSASPLTLLAFSDADWAGDVTDRRSTTGYSVFLGYSPILWRSKKQSTVSRSSTEAEYRALADTTSELVWFRWLLQDMGVPLDSSTPLYCDNKNAMQIAHNAIFHERTKHIEVDCHFIRDHCAVGTVHLVYVPSKDQVADLFTKSLTCSRLGYLCSKLQLCSFDPS
ncbi:hypothetical protein H6P81_012710 [Aristolochia fimbriata]|uniref:Integrase catalytic domain-containing protein n=1 Tax=Aristolochia fimbriata TaxID=158543 RepID=A0AAV7EFV5_ARIFI|nr:hypothetical protein H6P81_012710 [Aristolochia fimbriata]